MTAMLEDFCHRALSANSEVEALEQIHREPHWIW
jgi:hypothetical protein